MRCTITGETKWRGQPNADAHQLEHVRLFEAIRSGKPLNNGDYMARSTLFAIMGQISCYTGKEVTWDEISNSTFCFPPRPEACYDGMEPPVKPGPTGTYPVYTPGKTQLI